MLRLRGSRQVHVYRRAMEEVNHSWLARSAFEGQPLGVELDCMRLRRGCKGRLASNGVAMSLLQRCQRRERHNSLDERISARKDKMHAKEIA